nr:hypothetical protein [Candidatus Sigynarchaeota archaeon]
MGGVSPPKKVTVIISAIILVAGIIASILGFLGVLPSFPAVIPGLDGTGSLFVFGLIIQGFNWFLFFLGTRLRGL